MGVFWYLENFSDSIQKQAIYRLNWSANGGFFSEVCKRRLVCNKKGDLQTTLVCKWVVSGEVGKHLEKLKSVNSVKTEVCKHEQKNPSQQITKQSSHHKIK